MSKVKKEEDKKKTLSFSIDPRVYEENGIENYSDCIEKIIAEKLKLNNLNLYNRHDKI